MKMFQKIQELIDDKEALIFVLIDEVNIKKEVLFSFCNIGNGFYFNFKSKHCTVLYFRKWVVCSFVLLNTEGCGS